MPVNSLPRWKLVGILCHINPFLVKENRGFIISDKSCLIFLFTNMIFFITCQLLEERSELYVLI
jgi:hypothetical protein